MSRQATFRIILEKPTAGVDFGLQKGRGNNYETVQTQRSTGADLVFTFTAPVSDDPEPRFTGPFVQGPPHERFVYIDIGTSAGQIGTPWTRRLKIPLRGITPEMLDAPVLETRVPGTGRDGSPACATVKPFAGWSRGQNQGRKP